MSLSVADLGEHALIERVRNRAGSAPSWIPVGIGDDAAVIEPARGSLDVLTTDTLIEGVHFRRDWTPLDAVGHKALATSLSDLAAMGAEPRALLLSLAMPGTLLVSEFDQLIDGFLALATREKAPLVGGNISKSPGPIVVETTATGSVRPRRFLTRSGGRAGDELYVTGSLGAAAAGLAMLTASVDRATLDPTETACIARYERPDARLRCGRVVARSRAARACIDLSDGLADAARHLAHQSRTGVVIEAEALPIHPGVLAWSARCGADPIALATAGGEDYELLFAVPARQVRRFSGATRRCGDLAITRVGRLTAESGAWLRRGDRMEPLASGFVHF
jgi:thiamine-monophosphate kinase